MTESQIEQTHGGSKWLVKTLLWHLHF